MRSFDTIDGTDPIHTQHVRSSCRRTSVRSAPSAATCPSPSSPGKQVATPFQEQKTMKMPNSQLQEKLEIVVKCVGKLDGKDLCLTLGSKASVLDLKKLISRELASKGDGPISVERQRLIFFGRMLKDNKQVLSGEGGVNMKTDGSTNFVHLSPLPENAATASPSRADNIRTGIATSPSRTPSHRGPRLLAGWRRIRRGNPYPSLSRESTGRANRMSQRNTETTTAMLTDRIGRSAVAHLVDDMRRSRGGVRDREEDAVVPQDAPSAPGLIPVAINPHSVTSLRDAQHQVLAAFADGNQHLMGADFGAHAAETGFPALPPSAFLSASLPSAFAGTTALHPTSRQNRLLAATLATRFLPDVTLLSDRLRDVVWSAVMGGNSPDAFDQQVSVTIDMLERVSQISGSLAERLQGVSDSATLSAAEALLLATPAAPYPSHGVFSPSTLMSASTVAATDFSLPRWGLAPQPLPTLLTALEAPFTGQHQSLIELGSSTVGTDPAISPFVESFSSDPALLASIASVAPTVAALYGLGGNSFGQFMPGYPPPPPSGL